MLRLTAIVHIAAGIVFSGLFVLVALLAGPRDFDPTWMILLGAAGFIVAIPFSRWAASRMVTDAEEKRLTEVDREDFGFTMKV